MCNINIISTTIDAERRYARVSSGHEVPADDEAPRGYDYEPGLQIAEDVSDLSVEWQWQDDALCHDMHEVFDLATPFNNEDRARTRSENKYRTATARKICFECPVFQECWDDAITADAIPVGVIRAGARLVSAFQKVREKALMNAQIRYQNYREEQRHNDDIR